MWFVQSPQGNQGPFSQDQLKGFAAQGAVGADTLVWREGLASWVRLGDVAELAGASAGPAAGGHLPASAQRDDVLDGIFVREVEQSWKRHRRHQRATEVDDVLVGAVITATLDSGGQLIDLTSRGNNHYLRFERPDDGSRILFELRHRAGDLVTSEVLGDEAEVRIGYGERVQDFAKVWKAVKQELKGGFITSPDPGVITVDGDISSQYIYVEVGLLWDLKDYLDPDDLYCVNYPKLTETIGACIHALHKYLRGRLAVV